MDVEQDWRRALLFQLPRVPLACGATALKDNMAQEFILDSMHAIYETCRRKSHRLPVMNFWQLIRNCPV